MLTITRSGKWLTAILVLSLASVPLFAAPPGGGGGGNNKVSVTNADPSEAFQGEELDVTVTGSGFDSGSTVSYLVTGTTDASQVEVLSVQVVSSTELKTRIRPKNGALPTEYDIEVRTLSGRKGKGTTLFRVKVAEVACMGDEPKEPTIAFLTALDTSGDIHTQDLYLSSPSGCDQYLLLEDAVQILPQNNPNDGSGISLRDVADLRLDTRNQSGIVFWVDFSTVPSKMMGLTFAFDSFGSVQPDTSEPLVFPDPDPGTETYRADVRLNSLGQIELALSERTADRSEYSISFLNPETGEYMVLSEGVCLMQDLGGRCYQSGSQVHWSADGSEIYFGASEVGAERPIQAIGRLRYQNGIWQPAEVLLTHNDWLRVIGVSADGSVAYEYIEKVLSKGGKVLNRLWFAGVMIPGNCALAECDAYDGIRLPIDATKNPQGWTPSGGLLFIETGPGAQRNIQEFSNPYTGEVGSLRIENIDNSPYKRDTAF